jgi:hypothetical protein
MLLLRRLFIWQMVEYQYLDDIVRKQENIYVLSDESHAEYLDGLLHNKARLHARFDIVIYIVQLRNGSFFVPWSNRATSVCSSPMSSQFNSKRRREVRQRRRIHCFNEKFVGITSSGTRWLADALQLDESTVSAQCIMVDTDDRSKLQKSHEATYCHRSSAFFSAVACLLPKSRGTRSQSALCRSPTERQGRNDDHWSCVFLCTEPTIDNLVH